MFGIMGSWIFDLFSLDVLFYEFDVEVWIFWIEFYIFDFLLFEFWVLEFGVQAIPKRLNPRFVYSQKNKRTSARGGPSFQWHVWDKIGQTKPIKLFWLSGWSIWDPEYPWMVGFIVFFWVGDHRMPSRASWIF